MGVACECPLQFRKHPIGAAGAWDGAGFKAVYDHIYGARQVCDGVEIAGIVY